MPQAAGGEKRFAVLVFPGFPMMAFSAVVEPLRVANVLTASQVYRWFIVAEAGDPVVASNGIAIYPDCSVDDAPPIDFIVVCSGGDAHRLTAQRAVRWIKRSLRGGAHIGSVADGAFYLARAGLLKGYACTLHWQSQPAFAEAFPHIQLRRELFVIDRNRFTSAGGMGAFDMMLELIDRHHGKDLAQRIAEWFVHDRIRAASDRERLQLRIRTGIRNDLVLDAVAVMEEEIEQNESIAVVARRLGVSMGKLERAFAAELGVRPGSYYKSMRMERARDLLKHSDMPVRDIGLACGYTNFSAFVRAFHRAYQVTPRKIRKNS